MEWGVRTAQRSLGRQVSRPQRMYLGLLFFVYKFLVCTRAHLALAIRVGILDWIRFYLHRRPGPSYDVLRGIFSPINLWNKKKQSSPWHQCKRWEKNLNPSSLGDHLEDLMHNGNTTLFLFGSTKVRLNKSRITQGKSRNYRIALVSETVLYKFGGTWWTCGTIWSKAFYHLRRKNIHQYERIVECVVLVFG